MKFTQKNFLKNKFLKIILPFKASAHKEVCEKISCLALGNRPQN